VRLQTAQETLRDQEMETEKLKNQLRDQKTECERLRECNSINDEHQKIESNNGLETKVAEIEALRQEIQHLHTSHSQQLDVHREKQRELEEQVRLKEDRIKSLKDETTDSEEWQTAMTDFLAKEKEKNHVLQQEIEAHRTEQEAMLQATELSSKEKSELAERLKLMEDDYDQV